ncbi:hypothetical protein C7H19_19860 [Aphanothece hegewaldii CCALA 016]|uniref:Uncharacterized protein n=1 Tax=Aphanothece hegewaldii CCALA 016 TaxID=2107694 RepID=A0A2T1LT78_9CHRO|nr:hypothetical protein [Aphanothece hegewaldii]PSF33643.1 hypothetical protein C7H19_19860 [Aphanothece hegewaldii CCALA 016]
MKITQITYSRRGQIHYSNDEIIEVTIVNPENPELELEEVKNWVNSQITDTVTFAELQQNIRRAKNAYYKLQEEVIKAKKIYESGQEFLIAQGLKQASEFQQFPGTVPQLPKAIEAEIYNDEI